MSKHERSPSEDSLQKEGKVKKYSTIEYEVNMTLKQTRIDLIRKVLKEGQKLTEASKELGIKLSTSKFIIKSFKKYGRVFKKKSVVEDAINLKQLESEGEPVQKPNQTADDTKVTVVYYPFYIYVPVPYLPSATDIPTRTSIENFSLDPFSTGY